MSAAVAVTTSSAVNVVQNFVVKHPASSEKLQFLWTFFSDTIYILYLQEEQRKPRRGRREDKKGGKGQHVRVMLL